MYNFLISFGAALVTLLILQFGVGLAWWVSLLIALPVFAGVFFLISRFIMNKVMAIVEGASKDLQAQRVEKAIRELQTAFKYSKWQMYVEGQINAQIGMIHFMKREFNVAFPYLEKAFFKNWVAMGMLAVTYMKRSKKDKMRETFDKALQWSGKESLLWNLYAWCLNDCGERDKAIETLEKALKKIPGDENTKTNLELLKEGKPLKMKNYGEMWLQFHLEKQSVVMKQQMAAMGGMRRKFMRR